MTRIARLIWRGGPLLLAVAVAACASMAGDSIYNTKFHTGYAPSNFRSMAAAGAPIEIFGSPPGGATEEEIVASIRMPRRLGSTPPVVAEAPGQGQRLVFAFSVSGSVNGPELCAGNIPGGEFEDRLEVFGAFCRGDRVLTHSQMSIAGPVGPPDPQFTSAMSRLIDILGPRQDPNRKRNNCRLRRCR